MKIKNKKAMTGIIATLLLLIVTVLAYIVFQNWQSNFSNKVMSDFDQITDSDVIFEKLDGNDLYIKNLANIDLNLTNIKIDSTTCGVVGKIKRNNLTKITLNGCTFGMSKGIKEIALITEQGIFTAKKVHAIELTGSLIVSFELGTTCPIDYTKFYAIEYLNDSHAEISSSNLYTYSICLKHLEYSLTNSCAATQKNTIIFLDNSTNSHVYTENGTSIDPLTNEICLGSNDGNVTSINVTYTSTYLGTSGFTCIGSLEIDNVNGGHIGDCDGFPTKIWAKVD